MAYIGTEGFLVNTELREGKQHSQQGMPEFLKETLRLSRELTEHQLLIRMDSGNDCEIKSTCMRIVYEVIQRTIDKYGQILLAPDIEVNT